MHSIFEEIMDEFSPPEKRWKKGQYRYDHEKRPFKIVRGQYYGSHGVSNFWTIQYLNSDGSLRKRKISMYGDSSMQITSKKALNFCKEKQNVYIRRKKRKS